MKLEILFFRVQRIIPFTLQTLRAQLTFACSKATIGALEKSLKYVQRLDFEQVNVSWMWYTQTTTICQRTLMYS